jgi:hypothetical protein
MLPNVNVSGWKDLNPNTVYYFPGANLSSTVDYTLSSDGVVVVYLTHVGEIKLDKTICSNNCIAPNANRRLVLVSNSPITIDSSLFTATPSTGSPANIQAAIITSGSIKFDPVAPTATAIFSVVVEGPLVAKGGITFGRTPLSTYTYPSEVVVYNPLILSKLTSQERASSTYNYTGLFTSEIIWEGDL